MMSYILRLCISPVPFTSSTSWCCLTVIASIGMLIGHTALDMHLTELRFTAEEVIKSKE
jgi:hypothetical protein